MSVHAPSLSPPFGYKDWANVDSCPICVTIFRSYRMDQYRPTPHLCHHLQAIQTGSMSVHDQSLSIHLGHIDWANVGSCPICVNTFRPYRLGQCRSMPHLCHHIQIIQNGPISVHAHLCHHLLAIQTVPMSVHDPSVSIHLGHIDWANVGPCPICVTIFRSYRMDQCRSTPHLCQYIQVIQTGPMSVHALSVSIHLGHIDWANVGPCPICVNTFRPYRLGQCWSMPHLCHHIQVIQNGPISVHAPSVSSYLGHIE